MRKVTSTVAKAFMAHRSAKVGNTRTDGQAVYLHGNKIAWWDERGDLWISDCGWDTLTTRERLNGILRHYEEKTAGYFVRVGRDRGVTHVYINHFMGPEFTSPFNVSEYIRTEQRGFGGGTVGDLISKNPTSVKERGIKRLKAILRHMTDEVMNRYSKQKFTEMESFVMQGLELLAVELSNWFLSGATGRSNLEREKRTRKSGIGYGHVTLLHIRELLSFVERSDAQPARDVYTELDGRVVMYLRAAIQKLGTDSSRWDASKEKWKKRQSESEDDVDFSQFDE